MKTRKRGATIQAAVQFSGDEKWYRIDVKKGSKKIIHVPAKGEEIVFDDGQIVAICIARGEQLQNAANEGTEFGGLTPTTSRRVVAKASPLSTRPEPPPKQEEEPCDAAAEAQVNAQLALMRRPEVHRTVLNALLCGGVMIADIIGDKKTRLGVEVGTDRVKSHRLLKETYQRVGAHHGEQMLQAMVQGVRGRLSPEKFLAVLKGRAFVKQTQNDRAAA